MYFNACLKSSTNDVVWALYINTANVHTICATVRCVFGCERQRQTVALKKCHLHKLSNDKLQPVELKKLLNHHFHSHRYTVRVCSCVCVICTVDLLVFMINDTSIVFKSSKLFPSPLSLSSTPSVHRFSVNVEPGTKLESGPASLHLCNNLLVLTRGVPPVVIGHWKLSALRRYGAVPNGFVFEGGTRCGYCK